VKRLLGRRCAAGHLIDGPNGSWQCDGKGAPVLTCRRCNAIRAKLWRATNAHRLGYRVGATCGGKVLAAISGQSGGRELSGEIGRGGRNGGG